MASIDRTDWHLTSEFPEDLEDKNACTHIGIYLAWVLNNNLHGELHRENNRVANEVQRVLERKITGRDFFILNCDEKFWSDDLNDEGLKFTDYYYSDERTSRYFEDYASQLAHNVDSIYHVQDTWENYDKVAKIIDKRFSRWKSRLNKSWWEFWR